MSETLQKIMGQVLMDIVYWCVKVKNVIGNSYCGFTKDKLGLTSLIAFCNYMGWLCGQGKNDGCNFNFSKAFSTVILLHL